MGATEPASTKRDLSVRFCLTLMDNTVLSDCSQRPAGQALPATDELLTEREQESKGVQQKLLKELDTKSSPLSFQEKHI